MFTSPMRFDLGEDIAAMRDMVHAWAQDRLKPIAAELGVASEHESTVLLTTRQLGISVIRALNLLEERASTKSTGRARKATAAKPHGKHGSR